MKEMPEHAKREVMSCLRDLANRELQEQTWLQRKPDGPASPSELVSQLFDDTALSDYLGGRRDNPVFSSDIDALLISISALLDDQDLNAPPRLLLRSPQWREVQAKAGEAAVLIAKLLPE